MDSSNIQSINSSHHHNNGSIVDQIKIFTHEAVKTDEQLLAEIDAQKTFTQKGREFLVTENAAEASAKLDAVATDIKTKFQERLDEGTERAVRRKEKEEQLQNNNNNNKFDPIGDARQAIYDMTKSAEEVEAEKKGNMGFMETLEDKIKEVQKTFVNPVQDATDVSAEGCLEHIDAAAIDVKTKFQARLDEGKEREIQSNAEEKK
jgi:hypothetical protein